MFSRNESTYFFTEQISSVVVTTCPDGVLMVEGGDFEDIKLGKSV